MGKTIEELRLDPHREFRGVYKTARGRLAAFLTDAYPLFRRLLTGDSLHAFDNIELSELDTRGQRAFEAAEAEYFTLLEAASKEGRRRHRLVISEFLDNARREAVLLAKNPEAPGAPKKPIGQRYDVRLSIEAQEHTSRLSPGFAKVQFLKKEGRRDSDASALHALRELEYLPEEVDAIMTAKSARSAAVRLLAKRHSDRPLQTIRAAISRGNRLRREVEYRRQTRS